MDEILQKKIAMNVSNFLNVLIDEGCKFGLHFTRLFWKM